MQPLATVSPASRNLSIDFSRDGGSKILFRLDEASKEWRFLCGWMAEVDHLTPMRARRALEPLARGMVLESL